MDNNDKLYKQFQEASHKSEAKEFPAMEKVWSRVAEKLDKKEDRKTIAIWKKIAVAASLLLFFTLGYQFLNNDTDTAIPDTNKVVNQEKTTDSAETEKNTIRNKTAVPLIKEIKQESNPVAVADTESPKTNTASPDKAVEVPDVNTNLTVSHPIAEIKADTIIEKNVAATTTVDPLTGERIITGIVTDDSKLPLPGVAVVIKGTNRGTQTDFDGKFSIKTHKGEELLFSFIGFTNTQIAVNNSTTVNLSMKPSESLLESVVINTGYKTTKKRRSANAIAAAENMQKQSRKTKKLPEFRQGRGDYSGVSWANNTPPAGSLNTTVSSQAPATKQPEFNITAQKSLIEPLAAGKTIPREIPGQTKGYIDTDKDGVADIMDIEARSNASVIQNLQGQVAGLNVSTGSGQPGSDSTIILRGVGSINGNIEPLYIVDGVPVDEKGFRSINQNDIETIQVLRDAAATSIYGNRGGNGVIVITTKDGIESNQKSEAKKLIEVSHDEDSSFIENPFENPKNTPLSTFSIDVDNASYTNVRRYLNDNETVPKDAVRVEEMVNFFKYQYPQPRDSHPFSINTEYSDCPWNTAHKLVKIGLQGKNIPDNVLPASNLVFLIDVSGSMNEPNKLPLLVRSMEVLVNELREKDKVSIVVYAGAAGLVLPPTSGENKDEIMEALQKLNAGGSTAGGAGIQLAYKTAEENFIKGGNNRVVLATDGDFNVGASSDSDMQTLIEAKRKSGVFLTCLGFGMGNYKDNKMEILADKGNGNYAYIDNLQEANRFLGKEFKGSMFAIAKDVKIQIEFNPKHVQAYRLIGYENRKLRNEDFTNDAIDAGELGSGHTVTALYEIIPAGAKSDFFTEQPELKYTQTEPSSTNYNDELATIKFRYKKPDGDKSTEMIQVIENKSVPLDKSSDDFKFSAAVAWFGLKLRDSKLVFDKSSTAIKKLAKEGLSHDPEGYKAEFIRLVETVK